MFCRLRAQTHAFDLHHLLTLLGLALFLLSLVDELAVVKNAAYWGISIGRDLDEIEVLDTGLVQRIACLNDSLVAAICGDQAHMRHTNLFVYSKLRRVLSSNLRYT